MSRNVRRVVAGVLGVLVLATAACGGRAPAPRADEAKVVVDEALRAQLAPGTRDAGRLVVGTDPSYAPMSSFGDDGRSIVGMEPDLAEAIGSVLGVEMEVREVPFDQLLDQVADGSIDLAMSAMTDTPERARRVDFVNYFEAGTAILVQRGNPEAISGLADLCGTRVAVERETVQVDLLERRQASCGGRAIEVEELPTNSDALLRLRTGRATAVLTDLPPAALLATDRRSKVFYELASSEQYEPGLYGIAVGQDDVRTRDAVRGALQRLLDDGRYDEVLRRWNLETGRVPEATVNSAR